MLTSKKQKYIEFVGISGKKILCSMDHLKTVAGSKFAILTVDEHGNTYDVLVNEKYQVVIKPHGDLQTIVPLSVPDNFLISRKQTRHNGTNDRRNIHIKSYDGKLSTSPVFFWEGTYQEMNDHQLLLNNTLGFQALYDVLACKTKTPWCTSFEPIAIKNGKLQLYKIAFPVSLVEENSKYDSFAFRFVRHYCGIIDEKGCFVQPLICTSTGDIHEEELVFGQQSYQQFEEKEKQKLQYIRKICQHKGYL